MNTELTSEAQKYTDTLDLVYLSDSSMNLTIMHFWQKELHTETRMLSNLNDPNSVTVLYTNNFYLSGDEIVYRNDLENGFLTDQISTSGLTNDRRREEQFVAEEKGRITSNTVTYYRESALEYTVTREQ